MPELLIFTSGGCDLALPASHVREVVPAATLSSSLRFWHNCEGLLNLRGQIVPVVDLRALLKVEQLPLAATDFLVVANDDRQRLFAVRTSGEAQLLRDAEPAGAPAAGSADSVSALVKVGARIVRVLDPAVISPHVSGVTDLSKSGDGSK